MNVLVLNSGSSSLKYQLIDSENERCLVKGQAEKIGGKEAIFTRETTPADRIKEVVAAHDHAEALTFILKSLTAAEGGVIPDVSAIGAVGHRVVHGGEHFTESVVVDETVMAGIRDCVDLAPLHNPANLMGLNVCMKLMPQTPQVAVFDTAFHQTMPDYSFFYGLPYVMYTRHKIRRYGFHGTSHRYVSERAAALLGKAVKDARVVTCHLGNGSSVTAVKGGKSLDTSMGFTPLEGMIMGTRSGDVDAAAILHVMNKEDLSTHEANSMLNKHSGLLGVSGITNDVRELFEHMEKGDARAALAIQMLVYRLKKYVCAYLGALEGADAVVFTAGIGENNPYIREQSLAGLEFLGIKIDKKKNKAVSGETDISTDDSKIKVFVIPTNEELIIARDTAQIVRKKKGKG